MKNINYNELSDIQKKLVDEAAIAMETAYNPYSNFYVGAALLTHDDMIITGSNVENSAYGSSICAERSALLRANIMGNRTFQSLAVIGRGDTFDAMEPTAPCGSCRQMIFEASQLGGNDIEIILSNTKKDKIIVTSIIELLPLAFGPKDMNIDIGKYRK